MPTACQTRLLIDEATTTTLGRLADEVERILSDFESRLAGPCCEALRATQTALFVLDTGADDAFELAWRASGAQRLGDALYILSQVAGVAGLDVDAGWWAKERALLGLGTGAGAR